MGIQINLKSADFGESGFFYYKPDIQNGGVNIVKGTPTCGDLYDATNTKRLMALPPIYVKSGQKVLFTGLVGKDVNNNSCALRIDGGAYSVKENPSHSTLVRTISDSTSTYYTLNCELLDDCEWVNDIGDCWFVFSFGSEPTTGASVEIAPSGFDITIRVE